MTTPPAALPHDPARRIVRCRVAPWREPPRSARFAVPPCSCIEPFERVQLTADEHGDPPPAAGLEPGAVLLPDSDRLRLGQVALVHGHDGPRIGVATAAATDAAGLWASLKLGLSGARLVAAGHTDVSAATDRAGRLEHIALLPAGYATFASATLYDQPEPGQRGYLAARLHPDPPPAGGPPWSTGAEPPPGSTIVSSGARARVGEPAAGARWGPVGGPAFTVTGSAAASAPVGTALGSALAGVSGDNAVNAMSLDASEARAEHERRAGLERLEALRRPSHDEWQREYDARVRAEGQRLQREHREQALREAEERRAAKPTHSLRTWLDKHGWTT